MTNNGKEEELLITEFGSASIKCANLMRTCADIIENIGKAALVFDGELMKTFVDQRSQIEATMIAFAPVLRIDTSVFLEKDSIKKVADLSDEQLLMKQKLYEDLELYEKANEILVEINKRKGIL